MSLHVIIRVIISLRMRSCPLHHHMPHFQFTLLLTLSSLPSQSSFFHFLHLASFYFLPNLNIVLPSPFELPETSQQQPLMFLYLCSRALPGLIFIFHITTRGRLFGTRITSSRLIINLCIILLKILPLSKNINFDIHTSSILESGVLHTGEKCSQSSSLSFRSALSLSMPLFELTIKFGLVAGLHPNTLSISS